MASHSFRGRNIMRARKSRAIQDSFEDEMKLDFTKDPEESVREILKNVVKQKGVSNALKLSYMNAFVKLSCKLRHRKTATLTREEVFCCLRVGLVNESKEVRAATLRILRYICTDDESIQILIRLGIDHLIARSIDIWLDNEIERIHALRLVRRLLAISPSRFPRSIFGAILSVACDGAKERDRMVSVCLATLCEIAISNSSLFCECGGLGVILKSILDCYQFPRINESLLSIVLYLLNWPQTRHYISRNITLEKLLAPFTDNHYKFNDEGRDDWADRNDDRFAACKMAVCTMMKSWPGIIRMCNPEGSGLQSLLAVLYLPNMETQKEVMDILFEVFRLPVPVWTDDFNKALISIDTSDMRDSWRLNEGFVVQESKDILPHIAKARPNLVDQQVALVLLSLIGAGLPEALVEIVRTGSDFLLVKATILLSDMLYLVRLLFPPDLTHRVQTLPSLLALAASFDASPAERNRASMAVCQLKRLHAMRKRRPRPCSFFLSHLMNRAVPVSSSDSTAALDVKNDTLSSGTPPSSGDKEPRSSSKVGRLRKSSQCSPIQCISDDPQSKMEYYTNVIRDADHEKIQQLIRDSQVTTSKENHLWDWEMIATILKKPDRSLRKLEDPNSHRFVRRLLYYFKPSNNKFSTTELSSELHRRIVVVGLHFVELLATSDSGMELYDVARDLLADIGKCLNEIVLLNKSSVDSVFRPSALADSCSQYYFLFLGHFALTPNGESMLTSLQIYQVLLDIIAQAPSDVYVKVIIASFNYSQTGMSREILTKALTTTVESSRKFATSFMRVLLRARVNGFNKWGTQLLISQLADQSMLVATEALSVLSEATEDESCLKMMIDVKPQLSHLGYKGALLFARFLSDVEGFRQLRAVGDVDKELDKWHKELNMRYVKVVEERLNEALTTYEKSYDGSFVRRSHSRVSRKDCFVPVHLYGQLVQHEPGYDLLKQQPYIGEFFNTINTTVVEQTTTEEQVTLVKCALWVVGHIGSSTWGVKLLEEKDVVPHIIKLAEESTVFSLRGTAFYVLGLVASTSQGADVLGRYGWESTCRNRVDQFSTDQNSLYATSFPESSAHLTKNTSYYRADSFTSIKVEAGSSPKLLLRQESQLSISVDQVNIPPPTTSNMPLFFIGGGEQPSRRNTLSSQDVNAVMGGRNQKLPTLTSNGNNTVEVSLPSPSEAVMADAAVAAKVKAAVAVKDKTPSFRSRHRESNGDRVTMLKQESIDCGRLSETGGCKKTSQEDEDCTFKPLTPTRLFSTSGSSPESPVLNGQALSSELNCGSYESNKLPPRSSLDYGKPLTGNHVSRSPHVVHPAADAIVATCDFDGCGRPPSHSLTETSSGDSGRLTSSTAPTKRDGKDGEDADAAGTSEQSSSCNSSHADAPIVTRIPSVSPLNAANGEVRSHVSSAHTVASPATPSTPVQSLLNSHPSDVFRAQANLRRVPSMHRQGSHTALGAMCGHADQPVCEKGLASGDFDSRGFAVLRELRRQRTETPEEANFVAVSEEQLSTSNSTTVLDGASMLGTPSRKTSRHRGSLMDAIGLPVVNFVDSPLHRSNLGHVTVEVSPSDRQGSVWPGGAQLSPSERATALSDGRQEYIGICLPFDLRMMFQVADKENSNSAAEHTTGWQSITEGLQKQVSIQNKDQQPTDGKEGGLEYHSNDTCLGCMRIRRSPTVDHFPHLRPVSTAPVSLHQLANVPASPRVTGVNTVDKCDDVSTLTEDTPEGRSLVRKDVIRLIVNLASAIGCKSSEQSLLNLKQRFSRAFSDVCLYSEVCYLLSHYHYRLAARRFIQELFLDSEFSTLFDEPRDILGIKEPLSLDGDTVAPAKLYEVPEPPQS